MAGMVERTKKSVEFLTRPYIGRTLVVCMVRLLVEKGFETKFSGISFRDSLSGREAYLTGHRVAVWEVVAVHEETKSVEKTASHFGWPRVLVKRAMAYAQAFPEEICTARVEETSTALPAC